MKRSKICYIALVAFAIGGSAFLFKNAKAMDYNIPMTDVQAKVNSFMPYERKGLVITNVEITGQDDNTLTAHVIGHYNAALVIHEDFDVTGNFNLDYHDQEFFMTNFHINQAIVNDRPINIEAHQDSKEKLERAVNFMNKKHPVYHMKTDTIKNRMTTSVLQGVTIYPDHITAHINFF